MAHSAAAQDTLVGHTLAHYRIADRIGAGGMGEVYRAHDEHLDREVAIKLLPPGTLSDEVARKRFRKEALALSRLNHPNIATVHDFDTQQDVDFLVMEYIPGITLDDKLASRPLPENEVIALGGQLAEGMAAAHEQGVVHRDLKPGNLRLTPDGRLKILDFGLARLRLPRTPEAMTQSLSETQNTAGTLPYMAPEQLLGENADARTDIWAAGAVLYEMATGLRPFPGSGTPLLDAILHKPPVPPSAVNGKVSPNLDALILKCLDKDAANRYQTARELAVDLRRLSAAPQTPDARKRRHWQRWTLAGVGVLLLLAGSVWLAVRSRHPGGGSQPIHSLAVLPLANLSGDPSQEYFADGMTQELITDLGQLPAVRVISRTSIMRYKKTDKSLPEIARELDVDAVVEGSVLRAGDRVRITAQLVQASDRRLWGASYERDLRDVLALQSEVAGAIAGEIRTELTPQQQRRLASRRPVNPEAYALYLQGKMLWARDTEADNRAATEVLQRSLAMDPDFAPAYAALGRVYSDRLFAWDPKDEWKDKAEAAINKALALDPNLAEAYVSRAALLFTPAHGWQHEEAIAECRQALALNPNLADGHVALGMIFEHIGLEDEALHEFETAAAIEPTVPSLRFYEALALMLDGRSQEALMLLHDLPASPLGQTVRAYSLWQQRRSQELSALLNQMSKADPQEKFVYLACLHGLLLAESGQREQAEKKIREKILPEAEALKPYGHFHHVASSVAMIYAQLNEPEEAVKWLEEAAATGFPCYPCFDHNRAFDPIRPDPRFVAFMQKLRAQWEHLRSAYGSAASTPASERR
ncbi:MAG TPA: protein kinase [Candidatus Binatia bacterium]|nr:protein kinase [Candidatus Binatia bacterium]